jgi:hypothetical protein
MRKNYACDTLKWILILRLNHKLSKFQCSEPDFYTGGQISSILRPFPCELYKNNLLIVEERFKFQL